MSVAVGIDWSIVRYIKYLFDAVLQKQFQRFTQGATQDNLSQEKLLSLKLPILDDINVQKKIADILSTYDDLIETNRRRIELLEESARLLFREWFVYFRFPGHEKIKIVDVKGKKMPFEWDYLPITKITKISKEKNKVYDLEVENDPSFLIDNSIVHNSAGGYVIDYLIGITQINPLKQGIEMPHWRFISAERPDYPKILGTDGELC